MVEATGIFDCKITSFPRSYSKPPEAFTSHLSLALGSRNGHRSWGRSCGGASSLCSSRPLRHSPCPWVLQPFHKQSRDGMELICKFYINLHIYWVPSIYTVSYFSAFKLIPVGENVDPMKIWNFPCVWATEVKKAQPGHWRWVKENFVICHFDLPFFLILGWNMFFLQFMWADNFGWDTGTDIS